MYRVIRRILDTFAIAIRIKLWQNFQRTHQFNRVQYPLFLSALHYSAIDDVTPPFMIHGCPEFTNKLFTISKKDYTNDPIPNIEVSPVVVCDEKLGIREGVCGSV